MTSVVARGTAFMSVAERSPLQQEICELEEKLALAKARLSQQSIDGSGDDLAKDEQSTWSRISSDHSISHLHNLLLLSDSALPLGSFAFSSGLESFLAHQPKSKHTSATFTRFLTLSLASIASTTLPYMIAGFEHPDQLEELDNDLDASTTCVVAKRASSKQGRALLAVWERSFRQHVVRGSSHELSEVTTARDALDTFSATVKVQQSNQLATSDPFNLHGHLSPLFGTTCATLSVPLPHALYMYLFNHAKTIVSAGIRASVLGPYQAQGILASEPLRAKVWALVEAEIGADGMKPRRSTHDAGQSVPTLDLWGGRHEIVYSRIFNS